MSSRVIKAYFGKEGGPQLEDGGYDDRRISRAGGNEGRVGSVVLGSVREQQSNKDNFWKGK